MTEYLYYYANPWTDRLAWTLLHFLWQGSLIALALAAVRSLFWGSLSPRGRYGLACCALALMAAAPVVTYAVLGHEPGTLAHAFRPADIPAANNAAPPLPAVGAIEPLLPWTVAFWLAGAFACSLRLAGGWYVAARLRFAGVVHPAPPEWQRRLNLLAARIGVTRGVKLLVCSLAQTPMAVGHLRPVILIPLSALAGLPTAQLEALLAHELAHIWRFDYLANLVQNVVEALLFYHPAVWWVSKQIRLEREICCDDIAVAVAADRVLYARALAAIESLRAAKAELALAAHGGDLLARIRRLVDPSNAPKTRSGLAPAVALSLLLFIGFAAASVNRAVPAGVAVFVSGNAAAEPAATITQESAHPAEHAAEPGTAKSHPTRPSDKPVIVNFEPAQNLIPEAERRANQERERPMNLDGEPNANQEQRGLARDREAVAPIGWEMREPRPRIENRVLTSIEIRGFSDDAGNDLLARLPVHEGDRLRTNSLELVSRIARQFENGNRIEYRIDAVGENEAILYIHPAGSAREPQIRRK